MKLCIFGCGGGALQILEDYRWFNGDEWVGEFIRNDIRFIIDDKFYTVDTVRVYGNDYRVYPYSAIVKEGINSYGHISSFDCKFKKRVAKDNPSAIWLNSFSNTFTRFNGIEIGHGVRISSYCHVDSGVKIGNHVKINSQTFIGHDSVVGDYCYISQHVVFDNGVVVGEGSYIFEGSILMPKVHIGDNTIIGAGSVVTKDMPANVVAYGSPCKVIRPNGVDNIMDGHAVSEDD